MNHDATSSSLRITHRLVVGALLITAGFSGCALSPPAAARPQEAQPASPGPAPSSQPPPTPATPPTPTAPLAADPNVPTPPPLPPPSPTEVFPHVRVLTGKGVPATDQFVEFDAITSPMLVRDPKAPLFFLESIACTRDTREHESLLVTLAKPSHIHAALLIIGLKPGTPGGWKFENNKLTPVDPTGTRLAIQFVFDDPAGSQRTAEPAQWVVNAGDNRPLLSTLAERNPGRPAPGWVFAGSRLVQHKDRASGLSREVYDADESGTLIGLTAFGSETIAFSQTISPDAATDAPEWIACFDCPSPAQTTAPPPIPARGGTPIRVRIQAE